jgi:hypothetical protein
MAAFSTTTPSAATGLEWLPRKPNPSKGATTCKPAAWLGTSQVPINLNCSRGNYFGDDALKQFKVWGRLSGDIINH